MSKKTCWILLAIFGIAAIAVFTSSQISELPKDWKEYNSVSSETQKKEAPAYYMPTKDVVSKNNQQNKETSLDIKTPSKEISLKPIINTYSPTIKISGTRQIKTGEAQVFTFTAISQFGIKEFKLQKSDIKGLMECKILDFRQISDISYAATIMKTGKGNTYSCNATIAPGVVVDENGNTNNWVPMTLALLP